MICLIASSWSWADVYRKLQPRKRFLIAINDFTYTKFCPEEEDLWSIKAETEGTGGAMERVRGEIYDLFIFENIGS